MQGSGRTDAGVHALGQVANFHVNTKMGVDEMMEYMNFYLPDDIAVISLTEVPERFHSRLNAKGKTYCYRVIHAGVPHVFDRRYAHMVEAELDIDRMKKGAEYLVGTHDFKAFTSNKRSKKSTVRTISEIRIEKKSAHLWGCWERPMRSGFYTAAMVFYTIWQELSQGRSWRWGHMSGNLRKLQKS